jgi:putative transposase
VIVLTDIKNRGTAGVFFVVCDGLKGLPGVAGNVWRWRGCRPASST